MLKTAHKINYFKIALFLFAIFSCLVSSFCRGYEEFIVWLVLSLISSIVGVVILVKENNRKFSFGKVDYVALCGVAYFIFEYFLNGNGGFHPGVLIKIVAVFLLYIASRQLSEIEGASIYPRIALFVWGMIESIIASMQLIGRFSEKTEVVGTFFNSAHLALLLGTCILCGISIIKDKHPKIQTLKWVILLICLMEFILALICDSRTFLVGITAGLCVLFSSNIKSKYLKIFSILFVVGLPIALYNIRPSSADARILIWRASMTEALRKPILGHGVNAFQKDYMYNQSVFFADNPDSEFSIVANNNYQSFNEPLHIFYNYGILGLLIGFFLFLSGIRTSGSSDLSISVYLLVSSLFIYLFDIPILLIILVYCIGSNNTQSSVDHSMRCSALGLCHCIGIIFSFFFYFQYNIARNFIHHPEKSDIEDFSPIVNKILLEDRPYALIFAKQMNNKSDDLSLSYVEYIRSNTIVTYEMLLELAENYHQMGKDEESVRCLNEASSMIPSRIMAKYRMFEIYRDSGDFEQAYRCAQDIMNTKVKVVGSTVLAVRTEIINWLQQYE